MIDHKLIKGESNKMLVIFQGMNYKSSDMAKVQDRNFAHINYLVHEKLSYYKLAQKYFSDYNILFIKDNFSGIVGWYYFDFNNNLVDKINNFINSKYEELNCKELYLFGSSKGGFASILYAASNDLVNKAVSLCPQLDLNVPFTMYDTIFYEKIKSNINYYNRQDEIKNILPNVCMGIRRNDKVYVISSKYDKYFKDVEIQLQNPNINIEFIRGKEHSDLVFCYGEYSLVMLKDLIENTNRRKLFVARVIYKKVVLFIYKKIYLNIKSVF